MNSESTPGEGFVKTVAPAGVLEYRPGWLSIDAADALFDALNRSRGWRQRTIEMFGSRLPQPRLIQFQGDPGIRYAYSGDRHAACAWEPAVKRIRDRLASEEVGRFNSVLLNLYRDGRDSMGWHADDELDLGVDPVIASVSLGARRRFVLRRKNDHRCRLEFSPEHGSLIVMGGDLQHHWQHQVPKTRLAVGRRINLTFRAVHRRASRPDAAR